MLGVESLWTRRWLTYLENDRNTLSVSLEEIIKAVQDKGDGVVRIQRSDEV